MGSYVGFKKLEGKLQGHVDNPGAVAAAIGNRKYGKKKMHQAAASGHSLRRAAAKKMMGHK